MNANQTVTTQHTLVYLSTAACAERNAANKSEIDAGLSLPVAPNADMQRKEAQQATYAKQQMQLGSDKRAFWKLLDPTLDTDKEHVVIEGGHVYLNTVHSQGYSHYSPRSLKGWKLIFNTMYGNSDQKSWIVVGDRVKLGLNAKQLAKAKEHIDTWKARNAAKAAARNNEVAKQLRYKQFITVPEQNALLQRITGSSFVSEYGTIDFTVQADGQLKYKYDTFTQEQWVAVCDLRDEQNTAMKALKASFTSATTTSAGA